MNGDEALARLMEGHKRYESGQIAQKDLVQRRSELKEGQHPVATVVSCSDSRVVPEFIFDMGLGDVFTVISAGNVVDKIGLGSIEYAVGHLHTPLVVVMGHEKCGAVKAAYHDHKESNITAIVKKIAPAVRKAKKGGAEAEELEKACLNNIKAVIRKIKKSPVVKEKLDKGEVKIVGLKYYLDGRVEKVV